MRNPFRFLLLAAAILAATSVHAFAQEAKATKAQKKVEKKKEQRVERDRKSDLKGKKRHYMLQDKKTRKKMKRHRRRVNKNYPSDKPGFFRRIFRKKNYYI